MEFGWDEKKNKSNHNKHGIWFEEAQKVFLDKAHSNKEDRYIAIGLSEADRLLLVVYCLRESASVVRIISARKTTKKERNFYEKGIWSF